MPALPGAGPARVVLTRPVLALLAVVLGITVSAAPNRPPTFELPKGAQDVFRPREAERDWTCVASSADGRHLAAGVWEGRLYISTNAGVTWAPREEARRWRALASSADGSRWVAAVEDGGIHVSSDGGDTWASRAESRKWSSVASSSDGRLLVATVAGGRIHSSTNAGATWMPRSFAADWRGIASSTNGLHLLAAAHRGDLLASGDAGVTWHSLGMPGAWTAVASSADGRFLAAAESRGFIHVSADGGATWRMTASNTGIFYEKPRVWAALTCSYDAGYLAGVDEPVPEVPEPDSTRGWVFQSLDRSERWESRGRRSRWSAIAVAGNGRRVVMAARGRPLHTVEWTTSQYTLTATTNSGPMSLPAFATRIAPGSPGEPNSKVRFEVGVDSPEFFVQPPELLPDGTLRYETVRRTGTTTVTVVARGDGGTEQGGTATSPPQTFTLLVQGNAFRASPWTDDASTGISRDAPLWACSTGQPGSEKIVIAGVPVEPAPGPPFASPGQFSLEGVSVVHPYFIGQPVRLVGRGNELLAKSYSDQGNPGIIRLERLLPGRPYTLHVYGVAFPDPDTRSIWSVQGEDVEIDKLAFGAHHCIRVSHEFTPRTDSHEIKVTPCGGATWQFCGLALNAVPARAILESPPGSRLSRGGTFDFEGFPVGLSARRTFTIRNEGVVPLKDLRFAVEGPHAAEFAVIATSGDAISGEGRGSFAMEFRPAGPGPRSAALRLASNESEPFTLQLTGTGVAETAIPVSDLPARSVDEDQASAAFDLVLVEPAPGRELSLKATSNDPDLLPSTQLGFEGSGARRRLRLAPAPDRAGSAVVQVLASDGIHHGRQRFSLVVHPVNDPPQFSLPEGVVTPAGTHWSSNAPPRAWRAVASSRDGRRLAAAVNGGPIHVSTNAGRSWTPRGAERSWIALASSADGTRLAGAVADGPLVTSVDGGASWVERATSRPWSGIASSADGVRLVAVVDGGLIYVSADSGATWTPRDQPRSWHGVASSADGMKLAAVVDDGPIYVSVNGGTNWSPHGDPQPWLSISSSADGSVLVAAPWDGPILVSRDSGRTWVARATERFWRGVSCSADGRRMVAVETLGRVQVSDDFGMTWVERAENRDWAAVTCSGDGRHIAAAVVDGSIFTSAETVAPYRLDVNATGGPFRRQGFVTGVSAGPTNEAGQRVTWTVESREPALFAVPPSVDERGELTFVPAGRAGLARVTLTARDDGGRERGGSDTSEPRVFEIELRGAE